MTSTASAALTRSAARTLGQPELESAAPSGMFLKTLHLSNFPLVL